MSSIGNLINNVVIPNGLDVRSGPFEPATHLLMQKLCLPTIQAYIFNIERLHGASLALSIDGRRALVTNPEVHRCCEAILGIADRYILQPRNASGERLPGSEREAPRANPPSSTESSREHSPPDARDVASRRTPSPLPSEHANEEASALRAELDAARERIAQLEHDLYSSETDKSAYQGKIETLSKKITRLEHELAKIQAQLRDAKEAQKNTWERAKNVDDARLGEIEALQAQLRGLQLKLREYEELQAVHEIDESQNDEMESIFNGIGGVMKALQDVPLTNHDQADESAADMQNVLDGVKTLTDVLQGSNAANHDQADERELEALRKLAEEQAARIAALEEQNGDLSSFSEASAAASEKLALENHALAQRLETIQALYKQLEERVAAIKAHAQNQDDEFQELYKKLVERTEQGLKQKEFENETLRAQLKRAAFRGTNEDQLKDKAAIQSLREEQEKSREQIEALNAKVASLKQTILGTVQMMGRAEYSHATDLQRISELEEVTAEADRAYASALLEMQQMRETIDRLRAASDKAPATLSLV